MAKLLNNVGLFLMLAGIGNIYLSRFLLRKQRKLTGKELFDRNSKLEDIHSDYHVSSVFVFLLFLLFLYLIYQKNPVFWEKRAFVLVSLPFIEFSLHDAIFALSTKVFPVTTRYNWNSYVYDAEEKFRWVVLWQVGVAIVLLIVDYIIFRLSL